jgi:hypothetical protein
VEQLVAWVKEALDKTAYQQRLAIWPTHAGPLAAHRVADLMAISPERFKARALRASQKGT